MNVSSFNNSYYDAFKDPGSQTDGLILYLILLSPTILFNLTTIFFILSSPMLRSKINPTLVLYLAVEDFLLSLFCAISCAANYYVNGIYMKQLGCQIQSIYLVFFMLSTGYTLCLISYHNEQRVKNKSGLTRMSVFYLHLVIWIWTTLITYLSTEIPEQEGTLMESRIYCLISLQHLASGLLFFIPGVGTIGGFLIYRYTSLYLYIRQKLWSIAPKESVLNTPGISSRKIGSNSHAKPSSNANSQGDDDVFHHATQERSTTNEGINELQEKKIDFITDGTSNYLAPPPSISRPPSPVNVIQSPGHLTKQSYDLKIQAAKKMFLFVLSYFICALPVLILSIYEARGARSPGETHIAAGFMIHLASLINPLLYFFSNPKALRMVPVLQRYYYKDECKECPVENNKKPSI